MKYINKVEIKYFKGIYDESLKSPSDVNVISGKNDVGKSTVIEALDLFFSKGSLDFSNAYNKHRREANKSKIKGKQQILITVTFNKPITSKILPDKFKVTRVWGKSGVLINEHDNLADAYKRSKKQISSLSRAKSSLTQFLNKMCFIHVPSLRDDVFFSRLISLLQEELFAEDSSDERTQKIQAQAEKLNELISSTTHEVSKRFKGLSGIDTNLCVPTQINSLFQKMLVDTKFLDFDIPISGRGDGIKMHYIPSILNYISENSKRHFIWGFDEPENSCEYKLQKELANEFESIYSKNCQIFLCTHSFAFTNLSGPSVAQYRVFKDGSEQGTKIEYITSGNKNIVHEDLGLLSLNSEIEKLFIRHQQDVDHYHQLETDLRERGRPILLFEGSTDITLFKLAYKNLYGTELTQDFLINAYAQHPTNGSHVGSGAHKLNEFMYNHISKLHNGNKVIAIFDFDQEGLTQFKGLHKTSMYDLFEVQGYCNVAKHSQINGIFSITLQTPSFRSEFTDDNSKYCHLSSELLLPDERIPPANRDFPSKTDRTVFGFKGHKSNFANKQSDELSGLSQSAIFEGFRPTFELIRKLIEESTEPSV